MNTYSFRTKLAGGLFAAVALFTFATRGFAGPEVKAVAAPEKPPFNWTGFYIGLNLGGIMNNYEFNGGDHVQDDGGGFFEDVDVSDQFYSRILGSGVPGVASFFVPDHSDHDGEVMGGGQVGFQYQFGHWVIGIEGDLDRTATNGTQLFRDSTSTTFDEFEVDTRFEASRRAETKWMAALMGKLGYAQGPWLFYAIGGVAWCDVNTIAHDIAVSDFFLNNTIAGIQPQQNINNFITEISDTNISKDDDTRTGWTAGGGIEVAASRTVSFALEYRHSDFGSETYHYRSHNGIIFPGDTSVDLYSDQVTLKMNVLLNNFLFGSDSDVAGSNPAAGGAEQLAYANVKGGSDKDKMVQAAPVEEFNWSGLYVGGHIGGIWNDFDFSSYDTEVDVDEQFFGTIPRVAQQVQPAGKVILPEGTAFFRTPPNSQGGGLDNNSDAGIIGGGQAGYNYQWHRWVFGIEGDFSGSDTSGSEKFSQTSLAFVTGEPVLAVSNLNTMRTVQTNWSASLRGRVGYARGPLMVYATGGVTWMDVECFSQDTALTDFLVSETQNIFEAFNKTSQKDEDLVFGATVGGGIEWAFTKIASMGLEYRHNFYDSTSFSFDGKNGPIFPGSTNVDLSGDQVTFRVNFLLGHMGHY